jgi:hypothetical protein
MCRYQCPRCHEITHREEPAAFCTICAGPLTESNLLPDEQPKPHAVSLADLLNMRDAYSARA